MTRPPNPPLPAVSQLQEYLQLFDKVERAALPDKFKYGRGGFILAHGKLFPFDLTSFQGTRGAAHKCYMNAGKAALDGLGTYVEGYVSIAGVPIAHAWLADAAGQVVDLTLSKPGSVREYFGVPFRLGFLQRRVLETRLWGLLGDRSDVGLYDGTTTDFLEGVPC